MKNWFKVVAQADLGEIYIYGEIADAKWWGDEYTPQDVKDELEKLANVSRVNVYVNSPGGNVFAGVAIYNIIKRFDKPVTAYVDGMAASIASLIILAADEVVMPLNAMLMIHNPWTIAIGDSKAFRETADRLDKISEGTLVSTYMEKTGLDKEKIIEMMDAETWLSAEEAVELGFADKVAEEEKIAACYEGSDVKFKDTVIALDKFKAFPKSKFSEHDATQTTSLKQRHRHTINMLKANT